MKRLTGCKAVCTNDGIEIGSFVASLNVYQVKARPLHSPCVSISSTNYVKNVHVNAYSIFPRSSVQVHKFYVFLGFCTSNAQQWNPGVCESTAAFVGVVKCLRVVLATLKLAAAM